MRSKAVFLTIVLASPHSSYNGIYTETRETIFMSHCESLAPACLTRVNKLLPPY